MFDWFTGGRKKANASPPSCDGCSDSYGSCHFDDASTLSVVLVGKCLCTIGGLPVITATYTRSITFGNFSHTLGVYIWKFSEGGFDSTITYGPCPANASLYRWSYAIHQSHWPGVDFGAGPLGYGCGTDCEYITSFSGNELDSDTCIGGPYFVNKCTEEYHNVCTSVGCVETDVCWKIVDCSVSTCCPNSAGNCQCGGFRAYFAYCSHVVV